MSRRLDAAHISRRTTLSSVVAPDCETFVLSRLENGDANLGVMGDTHNECGGFVAGVMTVQFALIPIVCNSTPSAD